MAERLIEFYTSWPTDKLTEILTEINAGRVWATRVSGEQNHVRLLVDAAAAERVVDDVESRFSSDGTFRLFLLPVEASLPRPKEPEAGEKPTNDAPQTKEPSPPRRVSRDELYADLTEGLRVGWPFAVMVGLATVVAAIGLMRDSATVIIAAMVIAPLLKPNLALALGALPPRSASMSTFFEGVCMRRSWPQKGSALLLLGAMGACATNPATGKKEFMLVSEGQEIALGQQEDQKAVGSFGVYDDPALQDYVASIGHSIAQRAERPKLPWTFRLVDDAAVNAFALPGGFVYMTRGILAHLESEAELAMVMGHEVGHVTARHSASQMSNQQLMSLGVGIGMVAVPELRQYGDLAQLGLGLLFLKFGRDDENEADTLGLRYSVRLEYDVAEGAGAFQMLDRLSEQSEAGRVPGWLSTHPDPGDRYRRLLSAVRGQGLTGGHVRREAYLKRLDGMTFGENPREGFFRDGAFYHPDLRFRFELPRAFKGQNTRQAVWAVSPSGDAVQQLTLTEGESPDQAAETFFGDPQIRPRDTNRTTVNGLPAIVGTFDATSGQTPVRGVAAFVRLEGRVYRLIGYTGRANWSRYSRSFGNSLSSFGRLSERWALDVQPRRVDVVVPRRDLTLAQFMEQHPSTVPKSTIAALNQLGDGEVFKARRQAKRITGGRGL